MLNRIAVVLLFSCIVSAQSVKSCCLETLSVSSGLKISRLTIAPKASTEAIVHTRDYVFIPLTNEEVMQSIRSGSQHNPLSSDADGTESWVPRGSQILYVHPETDEAYGGQVTYNRNDVPYVALEIEVDQELPTLTPRMSLLGPDSDSRSVWRIGHYVLSLKTLQSGDDLRTDPNDRELFAANALTLSIGRESRILNVKAGELISLTPSESYKNLSTFTSRVLLLRKASSEPGGRS